MAYKFLGVNSLEGIEVMSIVRIYATYVRNDCVEMKSFQSGLHEDMRGGSGCVEMKSFQSGQ